MNIRYLTLIATLALLGLPDSAVAHPCERHVDTNHKHCLTDPPVTEVPAVYTAELTVGDFVFFPDTLGGLTANRKGTSLTGNQTLAMDPMVTASLDDWNKFIFHECLALVDGAQLTSFDVQDNNWNISYTEDSEDNGSIHLIMRNLVIDPPPSDVYNKVDFDLDFHGAVGPNVLFLPKIGIPSEFELTEYKLWAGAIGPGGFTCNSEGRPDLPQPSTLVITRVE